MKKIIFFILFVTLCSLEGYSQRVTIAVNNQPAAKVFREIMTQTGMNFVYSSDILRDLKVSIKVNDLPLKTVLDEIFVETDITYKIKGKNVILKKEKKKKILKQKKIPAIKKISSDTTISKVLKEVIIFPENSNVETPKVGFSRISAESIRNTPTLFGERDIIRTLHTQPGVTEGMEGMAGMYVDGGNLDENQYLLDGIPIYQANHFGGLFSAFNTDIIHDADFYKTSVPAKFNGRLSSYTDVKLMPGNKKGHHGSARLGLTSGAFNISGPIGNKTTYLVGIRRSWYDVLTLPIMAIINSSQKDSKSQFNYYFTDLNAKIQHDFNPDLSGSLIFYYSNDHLMAGSKEETEYDGKIKYDKTRANLIWGNLVVQTGINYHISSTLSSEFTLAFNNNFSKINSKFNRWKIFDNNFIEDNNETNSRNNIKDLIVKGDWEWIPQNNLRIGFGVGYTFHTFLPNRITKLYEFKESLTLFKDSTNYVPAHEGKVYFDLNWETSSKFKLNIGINGGWFNIQNKNYMDLSPRVSINYMPVQNFAIKGAYSHTVQYIHQLTRSYLALPTDQWIPVNGVFKPSTADKMAIGVYWNSNNRGYEISLEGYYKKMNNLIDYKDEYYLYPLLEMWNGQLTEGSGRARGIDFKVEKKMGKITGYISYSLAWADRLFKEKNGGKRFPSRFDNRHTINIVMNWKINEKISLNAAWVGHSGNRFTFMQQSFDIPSDITGSWWDWGYPLKTKLNNYSLPFYHRLDLSCSVRNKKGYWNFSLYNAYCHMNTIAIIRSSEFNRGIYQDNPESYGSIPVFKKLKLFPIIPSISYTWEF